MTCMFREYEHGIHFFLSWSRINVERKEIFPLKKKLEIGELQRKRKQVAVLILDAP